ncbi:hypothetical protein CHS0354_015049 [Potamilus streckersoni]|uniref:Solute carrier family 25 member 40 n=1 Tax=Potamilus streckersoni TaxID=2493646 RepID=A0AAE0TH41_9BIVA|nr:hypothetical protein CHS0354_015049 [Potamilus streckersoni]
MGDRKKEKDGLSAFAISPVQQMASSCSGAILTSLFVTPFDVVKIRIQAQQKPQSFYKGACFLYCNGLMDHICPCLNGNGIATTSQQWYRRPGHFTGMKDAFLQITRKEGITSLWSGLPPTLAMAVPATVIYFTCYEQLKLLFGHNYSKTYSSQWWIPSVAGAIARVWAVTLISPLELIRTKMQSKQLTYADLGRDVKNTVKQNGFLSLWRGLGPTLLRDVPFSVIYWLGYETVKITVLEQKKSPEMSFAEAFLAGAFAGTIAAVITLPFDVIKTHRQIELGQIVFSKDKKEVSSTWLLIQRLYRSQGMHGLLAGLAPRIFKVAPACAIMISSYEFFKSFFKKLNSEQEGFPIHRTSMTTIDNVLSNIPKTN